MAGDYHDALNLARVAGAGVAVWALVLLVVALLTRVRSVDPAPATTELRDETPAVVNLLTNDWRLTRSAVPATLLDLAARRVVDIDETEPDHYLVRTRKDPPGQLTRYEGQVLDHVRRLASDGVVPCEALTTGPEDESRKWWKAFERSVHAHARQLGLSRPRWTTASYTVLGVLALAPALAGTGAIFALPDTSSDSGDNPILGFVAIAIALWFGLMAVPMSMRADRDTPAGRLAAAHWLGVQRYLHDDDVFCDLPPAAVAVWDRYISYGAALGVSVGAVRALPLGSESEHEAWSSFGGTWHVVRIRYPRRIPPGWGRHPALVALVGLLSGAISVFLVGRALPALLDARDDIVVQVDAGSVSRDAIETGIGIAVAVLMGVFLLVLARAVVMLVLAVPDLFAHDEVDGRILRVRKRQKRPAQVAVDDGRHARVRAWLVRGVVEPTPGSDVHAVVTPRLGYVRSFTVTHAVRVPGVAPVAADALAGLQTATAVLRHIPGLGRLATAMTAMESVAAAQANIAPPAPLAGFDVAAASAAVDRPLHDVTAAEPYALGMAAVGGPGAEAAVLADDGYARVVLARWATPDAYGRIAGVMPTFLREDVAGVGGEAAWFARSTLAARDAQRTVLVSIYGFADEAQARATAEQLARTLLA